MDGIGPVGTSPDKLVGKQVQRIAPACYYRMSSVEVCCGSKVDVSSALPDYSYMTGKVKIVSADLKTRTIIICEDESDLVKQARAFLGKVIAPPVKEILSKYFWDSNWVEV